jgi:spore germination protein KC
MIRKKNKAFQALLPLFLMFPLLLTGCWNNRELTDLNIVAGLGLDRTDDGRILLTVQVAEPGAIQSSSSGSGGGGGEKSKPVFVASNEGETVFDALRGMLAVVDKKLFLSAAQVLILGERLAQDGIEEVLDFFQRDHEVSYLMDVLVAKGATPDEILRMESDIDDIPAVYIQGTVENNISRGTVKKTMFIDLVKAVDCRGRQPAIGQISKSGDKEIRTEGLAVFKGGKLVGWLDPFETRGYLFARNKVQSAIINVPVDEGKVSLEIMKSKGSVSVAIESNEPSSLIVSVEAEANVGGYEAKGRIDSPESLYMLEEKLGEEIKKEIAMALERCQKEYASDIFGFGTYLYKYQLQCWKKVEKDWNDVFKRLPVEIRVDAKISRVGIVRNPLRKGE